MLQITLSAGECSRLAHLHEVPTAKCTQKRNWMKMVLGWNTVLKNPSDTKHWKMGFPVSTLLHFQKRTSTHEFKPFMEMSGMFA